MARVTIYQGHSSIRPIFECTQTEPAYSIRIKKESPEAGETLEYENVLSETDPLSTEEIGNVSMQPFGEFEGDEAAEPNFMRVTRSSTLAISNVTPYKHQVNDDLIIDQSTDNENDQSKQLRSGFKVDVVKVPVKKRKRRLYCDICLTTFSFKSALKSHKVHYRADRIQCPICRKIFSNHDDYAKHRFRQHGATFDSNKYKFKCDYCNLKFQKKDGISKHILHYHSPYNSLKKKKLSDLEKSFLKPDSMNRKRHKSFSMFENSQTYSEYMRSTRSNTSKDSLLDGSTLPMPQRMPRKIIDSHGNVKNNVPSDALNPPLVQIYISNDFETLLSDNVSTLAKRRRCNNSNNDNDNNNDDDSNINNDENINNNDNSSNFNVSSSLKSDFFTSLSCSNTKNVKPSQNAQITSPQVVGNLNCRVEIEKLDTLFGNSAEKLGTTSSPLKLHQHQQQQQKVSSQHLKHTEMPEQIKSIEQNCTAEANLNTRSSTPAIWGTVGIELENLDIALKKLTAPNSIKNIIDFDPVAKPNDKTSTECDISVGNVQHHDNVEKQQSSTEIIDNNRSSKKIKNIYLSSICRTRFSTQKKLVYHYLNYHTPYGSYVCAVCRNVCDRLGELKKHLLLHCIPIPKSPEDILIDPKGPCVMKKDSCKGCKKSFRSHQSMEAHKLECKLYEKREKKLRPHCSDDKSSLTDSNNDTSTLSNENTSEVVLPKISQLLNVETLQVQSNNDVQKIENLQLPLDRIIVDVSNEPEIASNTFTPVIEKHRQPYVTVADEFSDSEKNKKDAESSIINLEPYTEISRPRISGNSQYLYSCNICSSFFRTAENLSRHEQRYRSTFNEKCKWCETYFPSRQLLTAHNKAAHSINERTKYSIYCQICKQGFSSKRYLRSHMMHVHLEELRNIDKYKSQQQTDYKITCRICDVIFRSRKRFIEHSMYYYEDRIFRCNFCMKEFYGLYKIQSHGMHNHGSDDSPYNTYAYKCDRDECPDRFEYQSQLRSHIFHVHGHEINPQVGESQQVSNTKPNICLPCQVCGEKFTSELFLSLHQQEFTNYGNYYCNQCNRRCLSLKVLENHKRRSHTSKVPSYLEKCKINYCSEYVSSELKDAHNRHFHGELFQQTSQHDFNLSEYSASRTSLKDCINITNNSIIEQSLSNDENWLQVEELTVIQDNCIELTCGECDAKFTSEEESRHHANLHKVTENNVAVSQTQSESSLVDHQYATEMNLEIPQIAKNRCNVNSSETNEESNSNNSFRDVCPISISVLDGPSCDAKFTKKFGSHSNDYKHLNGHMELFHSNEKHNDQSNVTEIIRIKSCSTASTASTVYDRVQQFNQPESVQTIQKLTTLSDKYEKNSPDSQSLLIVIDDDEESNEPEKTTNQITSRQYFEKTPAAKTKPTISSHTLDYRLKKECKIENFSNQPHERSQKKFGRKQNLNFPVEPIESFIPIVTVNEIPDPKLTSKKTFPLIRINDDSDISTEYSMDTL